LGTITYFRRLSLVRIFLFLLAAVLLAISDREVEAALKRVLHKNPEIVVEALKKFQDDMEKNANKNAAEVAKIIMADKTVPFAGNPKGDVTIIEFFDYNCGYCHKVAPSLAALLAEDKNIKVMFVDLPILSDLSKEAASLAFASNAQGKYSELHFALMKHQGGAIDAKVALEAALALGLDIPELQKQAALPSTDAAIKRHREWAKTIGITGTPSFIVGGKLIPGAVDKDSLKQMIQEARQR
jgi:protein-disulfide isomerase